MWVVVTYVGIMASSNMKVKHPQYILLLSSTNPQTSKETILVPSHMHIHTHVTRMVEPPKCLALKTTFVLSSYSPLTSVSMVL